MSDRCTLVYKCVWRPEDNPGLPQALSVVFVVVVAAAVAAVAAAAVTVLSQGLSLLGE